MTTRPARLAAALLAALVPAGAAAAGDPAGDAAPGAFGAEFAAVLGRLDRAEAEVRDLRARLDDPAAAFPPGATRQATFQDVSPPDLGVADQALLTPDERRREAGDPFAARFADRFTDLGGRVDALERGAAKLVTRGTGGATVRLFGRIHMDYVVAPDADPAAARFEGEDPPDRFRFRRLRLGVKGDVAPNMYYKLETEFADVDDLIIRDAYVGFRNLPFLQSVTVGNQKRPYGLDALNSSRYNVFIERPTVIEAFNGPIRRLGVAAYGVSDDLRYNWRYGAFNLEPVRADGISLGDRFGGNFGDGLRLQAAGRAATTYFYENEGRDYGHFAVAGTVGNPGGGDRFDPRDRTEARFRTRPEVLTANRWLNTGRIDDADAFGLLGLEHVYNRGPLQWTTEAQAVRVGRDRGADDAGFWGAYSYVSYFLTGEHLPWSRESGTLGRVNVREPFAPAAGGWGAWQVAGRLSYLDLNDADIFGGRATSLTLGLNWYWNDNAGMQVNYVRGRIADSSVVDGVGGAGPPVDSDYDLLGVRFRVDF